MSAAEIQNEDFGKVYRQALKDQKMIDPSLRPTFEELSEDFPDKAVPYLDRKNIDESRLTPEQKFWRENGYLVLKKVIPEAVVDAYLALRERTGIERSGWGTPVPYMFFEEIKDLCCNRQVSEMMQHLIGDEMGMHFNIPMFRSTERYWHQDDYLNPPETFSWYIAVWFALGEIHPDCGPFEFVPGSHKWPCVRSDRVKAHLISEVRDEVGRPGESGHWAQHAEVFTNPAYLEKLRVSGLSIHKFLGQKGDVLLWHGKLLHRGSVPLNPAIARPAIITHYSRISTRRDIGDRIRRHKGAGYYWDFPESQLPNWPDGLNMSRLVLTNSQLSDRVEQLEKRYRYPEKLREFLKQVRNTVRDRFVG